NFGPPTVFDVELHIHVAKREGVIRIVPRLRLHGLKHGFNFANSLSLAQSGKVFWKVNWRLEAVLVCADADTDDIVFAAATRKTHSVNVLYALVLEIQGALR